MRRPIELSLTLMLGETISSRSHRVSMLSPAFLLRRGSSRALSVLALASTRPSVMSSPLRNNASFLSPLEKTRLATRTSIADRGPSFAAAAARSSSTSSASSSSSSSSWSDSEDVPTRRRRSSASSASSSSSSSSSTRYSPVRVDEETKLYWQHLLSDLRRLSAARLARSLDLDFVLGLSGASSSAPPLARFFASIKEQHPTKIALVRVGEFYECIGADAVLLVEHAALNPMGTGASAMPRAGCPASNLKRTLDDLVRGASLSVVVAEEAPEPYSYGTRARKKERYIAGVVTPAQPHYFSGGGGSRRGVRRGRGRGAADENDSSFASASASASASTSASSCLEDGDNSTNDVDAGNDDDDDDTLDATPPILGVSAVASASGFSVVEVDVELRRFSVFRGLTEDAVSARLFSGGLSPPLYLHSPDDSADPRRYADASAEQEWSKRVSTLFRREVGVVKRYGFGGGGGVAGEATTSSFSSANASSSLEPAVAHLLSSVRRDLGLPPNEPFAEVKKGGHSRGGGFSTKGAAAATASGGPQVYLCTASQLGIHRQRGVPSLLDALLPSSSYASSISSSGSSTTALRSVPLASRRWLERLLLMPPAPEVARDVRRALEVLGSPSLGAVPRWLSLPAPHIVLKLRSGEASAGFFRDLVAMLDAVVSVCATTSSMKRKATAATATSSPTAETTTETATTTTKTIRGEEPKHQLLALAQALLSPTAEETGTRLSLQELAEACERAVGLVEATVADVRGSGGFFDELLDLSKFETKIPSRALRSALLDLFEANEGPYSGQVHASLVEGELAAVDAARERVASAAAELVSKASERAARSVKAASSSSSSSSSSRAAASSSRKDPEVVFDAVNNAVWVRMPRGSGSVVGVFASDASSSSSSSTPKVIHPLDRYGRRVADRWSSAELEEALDAYRRRCVAARSAVRGELRALARELADGSGGGGDEGGDCGSSSDADESKPSVSTMAGLVSAATFSTIGAALDAHAREAAARGWGLPRLVGLGEEEEREGGAGEGKGDDNDGDDDSDKTTPPPPPPSRISITDFWPYWKENRDSETNSIDLRSMALLTGPNMAGKSTVLRSVAACSLLASCGLRAPAAAAEVPPLDAIVLRAFAADAPSSGRSSFAVEMDETRHVLAAATAASSSSSANTLILVDELGKGTEPAAGAAVAGAVLESLAERGCLGLFATHLHELLELPLERYNDGEKGGEGGEQQQQQQRFCMTTKGDPRSGTKVPAWRLAEGDSTESLAIEVAAEARVDPGVVARAAELYAALCEKKKKKEEEEEERTRRRRRRSEDDLSSSSMSSNVDTAIGVISSVDASIAPRAEQNVVLSNHSASSSTSLSTPPLFSLEDAAAVLSSAAAAVLQQALSLSPSSSSSSSSPSLQTSSPHPSLFHAPSPAASLVRAGWAPPPAVVARSCVYVVRRADGYFYCGESDDLMARLTAHRSRPPVAGGASLEACFLIVGSGQGGKTAARAIEAASIRSMVRAGLPLLSEADGVHRSGLVAEEGESTSAAA